MFFASLAFQPFEISFREISSLRITPVFIVKHPFAGRAFFLLVRFKFSIAYNATHLTASYVLAARAQALVCIISRRSYKVCIPKWGQNEILM